MFMNKLCGTKFFEECKSKAVNESLALEVFNDIKERTTSEVQERILITISLRIH